MYSSRLLLVSPSRFPFETSYLLSATYLFQTTGNLELVNLISCNCLYTDLECHGLDGKDMLLGFDMERQEHWCLLVAAGLVVEFLFLSCLPREGACLDLDIR